MVWTMQLIGQLAAFAALLQGIEILCIRSAWSDQGLWTWDILKKDYKKTSALFGLLLNEKTYAILMMLQVGFSTLNMYFSEPLLSGFLFFTTLMTANRFRGTFNGGSDYMTALVLAAHLLMGLFEDRYIQTGFMWYIAIQLTLSYFIAGVVKIKEKEWRSGVALTALLTRTNYIVSPKIQSLVQNKFLATFLSWAVLIFECTFPLALINSQVCAVYLAMGFLFHLGNFFVLGLNRFVFAWLAAYPALYYLSGN